jgi:hypothetical protein
MAMIGKAQRFLKPGREECYNGEYFFDFFLSILQASRYITNKEWSQVVNKFHEKVILKHTDPNCFTFDGLYKGSLQINIGKLLAFVDEVGVQLPEKRIDFLKRVEIARSIYFPELSSTEATDRAKVAAKRSFS